MAGKEITPMEKILNNPGLQHLAETIFWNLDCENLEVCREINQSSKEILDNPMFWLGIFVRRGLSMKNQKDWIKAIQLNRNSVLEQNIIQYLKFKSKNKDKGDLPCYTNPIVQDEFQNKILDVCDAYEDEIGNGTEVVKTLAPLTDNPNAPDGNGLTPIRLAALKGHTEIIKILGPLTDNPNAPDDKGVTPIHLAAHNGHSEVVKILAPLSDNPNAPNHIGWTPILTAAINGHTEIVKLLAPLTDNPNAPDDYGRTPISVAKTAEIRRILNKTSAKRKNKISAQSTTKRTKKI